MAVGLERYARALIAALVLTVGGFAVGLTSLSFVAQLLVFAGVPLVERPALNRGLSAVMLQGLGFGSVALAYLHRRDWAPHLLRLRRPSRYDAAWVVVGFLTLLSILAGASAVLSFLDVPMASHRIAEEGVRYPVVFLVMIPLSFLLVGPGEELLFRGMIQGRLLEAAGPAAAIGVTSVIFAVIHASAYQGEGALGTLFVIFLLSVALGAIYEYTDNLVVPALVHGAYNAAQFALLYVRVAGGVPIG